MPLYHDYFLLLVLRRRRRRVLPPRRECIEYIIVFCGYGLEELLSTYFDTSFSFEHPK